MILKVGTSYVPLDAVLCVEHTSATVHGQYGPSGVPAVVVRLRHPLYRREGYPPDYQLTAHGHDALAVLAQLQAAAGKAVAA